MPIRCEPYTPAVIRLAGLGAVFLSVSMAVPLVGAPAASAETTVTFVESWNVGNGPQAIAVSPDGSSIYVLARLDDAIQVLDADTGTVQRTVTNAQMSDPNGMSLSPDGTKLVVTSQNTNRVLIFDTASWNPVITANSFNIPFEPTISADGQTAYISNYVRNAVTPVDIATGTIDTDIAMPGVPGVNLVNASGTTLFTGSGMGFGFVYTTDLAASPVSTSTARPALNGYADLLFNADQSVIFATNGSFDQILALRSSDSSVIATAATGDEPHRMVLTNDGTSILVTLIDDNAVQVLSSESLATSATVALPASPRYIALSPNGRQAYVTSFASDVVMVLDIVTTVNEDPAQAPPDVMQQVARPAEGCEFVERSDLNWAGVPGGGWGSSWAQWPNEGRGGDVCVRVLTYLSGQGRWGVR